MKMRWLMSVAAAFTISLTAYVYNDKAQAQAPTKCTCASSSLPSPINGNSHIGAITLCQCGALQCIVSQSGTQYGNNSLFCSK
jgi:hypothetical protein